MSFVNITPISQSFSKFCVVSEVFDKREVEKIIDLEDLQKFQKGAVARNEDTNTNIVVDLGSRNSDVFFMEPTKEADWLYRKISDLIPKINYDHFLYTDIKHMNFFQYTVYDGEKNQHYDWHIDAFSNHHSIFERKISMSVLLTEPDDYDGGEFHCVLHGRVDDAVIIKPNAGDIIFFDSTFPHKVAPVTKGFRKSLVSWIMN